MRQRFAVICVVTILSSCGPAPVVVQEPVRKEVQEDHLAAVVIKELPEDWNLDEILDAMPPRSDDGPTHVIAWKLLKDDRPMTVHYCLAVKKLKKPTEKNENWVVASLARNPAMGKEWRFVTIWITPDRERKNPPLIDYVEDYVNRPTNADLHKFMDKYEWKSSAHSGWRFIDGGVCAAWENVLGEKPVRAIK
jgi:hypothetical protein